MANSLNFTGAKKLNDQSPMPHVAAFSPWCEDLTLGLVTQTISTEGDRASTVSNINFYGSVQPLSVRSLVLKPEGQRSWSWKQIHVFSGDLNLRTQDLIIFDGVQYKVMGIWNYALNGFMEYHIVTDYVELP